MGARPATTGSAAAIIAHRHRPSATALHDLSEEELARQAKRGCQAAFAELVRRFAPRLRAFLSQRTANRHDAEDLVQDTFVSAYQSIGRYRKSARFSTWLFTIGARLAVSHHRKLKVRSQVRYAPSSARDSCDVVSQKEEREGLWATAQNLPERQYQVLWLKYGQDMSVKDIARVMHRTQVSVKVLLYRARVNLAARLQEREGEPGETDR
jgi:RNA polymerase sigma-70 factor (ECF subfamily)